MKELKCLFLSACYLVSAYAQDLSKAQDNDTSWNRSVGRFSRNVITHSGLLTIHQDEEKYFLEIPEAMLEKDFLMVSRIAQTVAGTSLYSGDEISNMVLRFEKIPGNKILLRKVLYGDVIDTTGNIEQRINISTIMPIIGSFKIDTGQRKEKTVVIDLTEFVMADNEAFSLNPIIKSQNFITGLVADKSYISKIKSFPINTEISCVKTYTRNRTISTPSAAPVQYSSSLTIEINVSIVKLPEQMMNQRLEDPRVGYFSLKQVDYTTNPNGVRLKAYVKRWRLEPSLKDIPKYKMGELVNPAKPIVFYIDPSTPKKWVPFLIQGVNDWKTAFEQAGFSNAIYAREAPSHKEDSTWSIHDAQHSAIVYKPSPLKNASGPSISDPRTGEILESHINWYHNVLQLVHDWYFVQCSVVDPRAQALVFPDSLMGQIIRSVIAHEVGHALGLLHNMGSSSLVPVNKLRDSAWVSKNGICPSIMDYARFNFVAQPEDHISQKDLINRIGIYDKWAIEWGYRVFYRDSSEEKEASFMNKWVIEKTQDQRLWFSSERSWDPRSQTEDLSDNPVLASEYGIKNLKRLVPSLISWTSQPDQGYENLSLLYKAVQNQYKRYVIHVIKYVGGTYENIKLNNQPGPIYRPVEISRQKAALRFLKKEFFNTPLWLLDSSVLSRTGQTSMGVISDLQLEIIQGLILNIPQLAAMDSRNMSLPTKKSEYSLQDYFSDLHNIVWEELYSKKPTDVFRRNLQKAYVLFLVGKLPESKTLGVYINALPISGVTNITSADLQSIYIGELKQVQLLIKRRIHWYKDKPTINHLNYLKYELAQVFGVEDK